MKMINFQSIALGILLLLNTGILVVLFSNQHITYKTWSQGDVSQHMHPTSGQGEYFSTHGHRKGKLKKNHQGHRGEMGFLNPQLMKELNLSEEQQANIKALRERQRTFMKKNHEETIRLRKELFQLSINEKSDQKQIDVTVEKIGQQEKINAIEKVKFFRSIQQVLSPEQKEKVVEFRRQNKEE